VIRQEAGVEQETSGQEEVRDNGITSAAAEVLLFQPSTKSSAKRTLLSLAGAGRERKPS
jgi:hypothetical protein